MIELLSDALYCIAGFLCFVLALVRLNRVRSRPWLTLTFSYGCNLFAQVYWSGYSVVFGETPRYFYVSELGWAAMYVFIIMLLAECDSKREYAQPVRVAWIPVVVSALLFVLIVYLAGNVPLNLADNGLMAIMGYFAVKGLFAEPSSNFSGNRAYSASVLVFVIVELALWTASCFYSTTPIPYIVLSNVLTASTIGMLVCAWKSEQI